MSHVALRLISVGAIVLGSTFGEARSAQPRKGPASVSAAKAVFSTAYARITLDSRGFITSLVASKAGKEYVPRGRPSPLMSLHVAGQPAAALVRPVTARLSPNRKSIALTYPNRAVATVSIAAKDGYFRFQLDRLVNRGKVDAVVWGPLDTTISRRIGDLIGVVRDDEFAIGMFGLEDNTVLGTLEPSPGFFYTVHSSDPQKFPVPAHLKEGQRFPVGGDGVNDVAFYSKPEEYFQMLTWMGAVLRPEFGSTIAYHAVDRRRPRVIQSPGAMPGQKFHPVRHMVTTPVPGVDFVGSALALYACPDEKGLGVLEQIFRKEGLPFITDDDGTWIRNPKAVRPTLFWNGPVDKCIDYAKAMGFKDVSRDTGEFYPSFADKWVGRVTKEGKALSYREFGEECHKAGLHHGGLHTLHLFLQPGISTHVSPVPSEHLATVCRVKLAKDISSTATEIVVDEPSFLAEKGCSETNGLPEDKINYVRVGAEMMTYDSISASAPWTLKGVKRGVMGSKPLAHRAGDELAKLYQNCYNGFLPDLDLQREYADYYADLMARNAMDDITFDGYESSPDQGGYGMGAFNRRLFETYRKLTGRWPHITLVSGYVGQGAWGYLASCNVGGGPNMFDPHTGRWITEGKDIRHQFGNVWFPPTFGIINLPGNLADAENMMAKAIGWDSTFALSTSADDLDKHENKEGLFKAFKAWQEARARQLFSKKQKEKLQNPALKFHLVKEANGGFTLHSIPMGEPFPASFDRASGEKVGR